MYKRDELPVRERPWVRELLNRESFTGKEAGELAGKYGADAITQLRNARGLRLVRVGKLEGGHHRAGRFRLVDTTPPPAAHALTLNEIGAESLRCSAEKGFETVDPDDWQLSDPPTCMDRMLVPTKLALIHSEVSEALEEFRKDHRLEEFGGELADIIIRVGQLGVGLGIDLDAAVAAKLEKNRQREHRHGGRLI